MIQLPRSAELEILVIATFRKERGMNYFNQIRRETRITTALPRDQVMKYLNGQYEIEQRYKQRTIL